MKEEYTSGLKDFKKAEYLSLMNIAQVARAQPSVMPKLLAWTHILVRTGGFLWTLSLLC
jgi:hypothetical protein